MDIPRRTFRWTPGSASESATRSNLGVLLSELVADRAMTSRELVREASRTLLVWLETRPSTWTSNEAALELSSGLGQLDEAHRWRATVAAYVDALLELAEDGRAGHPVRLRDLVIEECGLWMGGANASDGPWNGVPLAPGARLPDPGRTAAAALEGMEPGEVILVHGYSQEIAAALVDAAARGLRPQVVASEGGPELHGRRLVSELAQAGVGTRFVHDLALFREVAAADRVWLTTESIGAEAMISPLGSTAIAEEARRREVPVSVPTITRALAPGGAASMPPWGNQDRSLLWHEAPSEVDVEPCPWERVPLHLIEHFATERGRMNAGELALAALRTDAPVRA